jgi:uncharacterized membrane protein YvbJ
MNKCPKCNANNDESAIRCATCDAWLLYYEFKGSKESSKETSDDKHNKKEKTIFLPDNLITDDKPEAINDLEKVLRFGQEFSESDCITPDHPLYQQAFSPKCPTCGGDVKTYEVKCRHCNNMLNDKIAMAKKLKPYWEKMFRDKILQDGDYVDIYSNGEVKFIFKKLFDRENKMVAYLILMVLLLVGAGLTFMYCVGSSLLR